ncbi:MAG: hypothetical protein K6F32_03080 [Bacilli bacterium]|nr:hypothetical protein [Bacilli bacterium]
MKTNRAVIILHMLFCLREKGVFTEKQIIEDLAISRSSFFRAISEFRCYLQEFKPWYELASNEKKGGYVLIELNQSVK